MSAAAALSSSDGSQISSRTLVSSAAAARATSARPVSVASIRRRRVEDEGGFLGLEHEIDRHQHGAEPRQRKPQRRKGVRIARQDGDAGALADAARGKPRREAVAHRIELGVAPPRLAANDRGLVGKTLGGAAQQIGKRLAAKRCVHEVLPRLFPWPGSLFVLSRLWPTPGRLPMRWKRDANRKSTSKSGRKDQDLTTKF